MRRHARIGLVVSVLAASAVPAHAQGGPVVLRGGWVFDTDGGAFVRNRGLLVVAGKIARLGEIPAAESSGARVIELTPDEYVTPGMFDLHAHYAVDLLGKGRVDDTTAYPVLFLANGVTSTFPAGEMDPEKMRRLRIAIDNGERPGPRIFNSGPYFGSWRRGWDAAITADSIAREVDYWAARGVRGFKAKGITPVHLRALIERAHVHGLTVTGHLDSGYRNSVNPRDAILLGIDRVEHFLGGGAMPADRSAYASLEIMDTNTAAFRAIVRLYLERHVYFDATLSAYGYYGRRDPAVYTYFTDEMAFLTPYMREVVHGRPRPPVNEQFERIYWVKRRTLKAFYDAGGADLITLGTDHPSWGEYFSGFAVHRELLSLVLSGIPPAAALKIATINGARALGAGDYLGSIEVGKYADLVVVRGDPLADITSMPHPTMVMKAGVTYDPQALLRSVAGTLGPRSAAEQSAWIPREEYF